MYIATTETRLQGGGVVGILPVCLRRLMYNVNLDEAEEMRLVIGSPFCIRYRDGNYYLTHKANLSPDAARGVRVTRDMLLKTLERITKSSLYSYKEEIRSGYITVGGGHRVGLAGTTVIENNTVGFIKNISAMNIRIANEIRGAADSVADDIYNNGAIRSTLVISPPGAGKTTMLRDIARQLSYRGAYAAIADERCEIAAMKDGRSPFDIGFCTTVMDACPKDIAMLMLLRSMSPDVIITDELGTESDVGAVRKLINSGCAVAASVHAKDEAQLKRGGLMSDLLSMFNVTVTLSKANGAGHIETVNIYD